MEEDDWSFGPLVVLEIYVRHVYVYVLISRFSFSFSISYLRMNDAGSYLLCSVLGAYICIYFCSGM